MTLEPKKSLPWWRPPRVVGRLSTDVNTAASQKQPGGAVVPADTVRQSPRDIMHAPFLFVCECVSASDA